MAAGEDIGRRSGETSENTTMLFGFLNPATEMRRSVAETGFRRRRPTEEFPLRNGTLSAECGENFIPARGPRRF